MQRFASNSAVRRTAALVGAQRTFFGKGWDAASLDVCYQGLLRKPEVNDRLRTEYTAAIDTRTQEAMIKSYEQVQKQGSCLRVFLPPHLGCPHRVLKAYSLTAYPILDDKGEQLKIDVDGTTMDAFADPDDDFAKVCLPNLEATEFLAQELLVFMGWEATPRGAASLLESLYRGAEIPDHVFQTQAVIEREY
jgi:hypothetical protein